MRKEVCIIGLGKMGLNMKLRLEEKGWNVLGLDKNPNLSLIVEKLKKPRIVWLMVPAGKIVENLIFSKNGLVNFLDKGDIIIDGGNSFFEDSKNRKNRLVKKGVHFLDVGVSGGPDGARNGACLMIGGDKKIFLKVRKLFKDLAKENGFAYVGSSGAGHFVKMVHNGIEYGMMQAIAEGFTMLKFAPFNFNLKKIANLYNNGSVIESRLIGWLERAFYEWGEDLKDVSGIVDHTGETDWMVRVSKKYNISVKTIEESLKFRILSKKNPTYTSKIVSALRGQFGKHKVLFK
jgi:6-phosphogluconate dehydrogenase